MLLQMTKFHSLLWLSSIPLCVSIYLTIYTTSSISIHLWMDIYRLFPCARMNAKSLHSYPTLCDPVDCSLAGSSVSGVSPGKNTEVGCHALLQGIFLTQGSNLCLLHLLHWQAGSILLAALGEKAVAPHSSTLAWKIPWMKEPGRLQSMGSLRVGHDWATSLSCIGEGDGNPLQCSCLENPKDRGAWWAAVYGIAKSLDMTDVT